MKAIILSAGQGRRLFPHTTNRPSCLVPMAGERTLLDVQLDALASNGVDDVTVVAGCDARRVEAHLARRPAARQRVRTFFDPSCETASSLVTCRLARDEMSEDFVLLEGDVLFERNVLSSLLHGASTPVAVAVNEKTAYTEADVKAQVEGGRLRAIARSLDPEDVTAESVGMMLFRGSGVTALRTAFGEAIRDARQRGVVSLVNELAGRMWIDTVSITGHWWAKIDTPFDLARARTGLEQLEMLLATGTYGRPGRERIRRWGSPG